VGAVVGPLGDRGGVLGAAVGVEEPPEPPDGGGAGAVSVCGSGAGVVSAGRDGSGLAGRVCAAWCRAGGSTGVVLSVAVVGRGLARCVR
jgi:hypothetical protein